MAATTTVVESGASAVERTRWRQLICAIICMVMIANLQYGWTLFVNPINKAHGWSIASIQFAFAIFIALETWLTPIEGWIVDVLGPQRGPKVMLGFGGIFVGAGWVLDAYADSLTMLYLGAVVLGIGGGAIYATCVGMAVKWFPDRRGLAVGLTAAGYGAGAALSVIPIQYVIANYSYNAAFLWFGLGQGAVVFVLAMLMRGPEAGEMAGAPAPKVAQSAKSFSPREVLMSPVFWVLYIMFVMVSASGLMATAQIAPIAKDFSVGNQIVFWGATTLTAALIIDNVANGTARPLFGWISDHIGRETHHGDCLRTRRRRLLAVGGAWHGAVGLRAVRGADLPDLGRNLQPVPVDLHRHVRPAIRHGESWPALHRQGHLGVPGAGRQPDQSIDRQLVHGVRGHRADEFHRGGIGALRAQADAVENDGARLKTRRLNSSSQ